MAMVLHAVTVGAAATANTFRQHASQPDSHWTGIAGGARYSVSLLPWKTPNISSAPPYVPIYWVHSRFLLRTTPQTEQVRALL